MRTEMRRVARIITLVLASYCILQTAIAFAWNARRFRSCGDVALFIVFLMEDTTAYSDRYSEQAFRSISSDMTAAEVEFILGAPIEKQALADGKGELWRYTSGQPDRNYWLRCVRIDLRGTVSETRLEYWVD